jgi:hypothetical protein
MRGASGRQVLARRRDDGARCGTKHHALYSSGMKRDDSAITRGSDTDRWIAESGRVFGV